MIKITNEKASRTDQTYIPFPPIRNISLKNCVNLIRSRRPMAFPIPFTFYKLLKNAEDRFIKKDYNTINI